VGREIHITRAEHWAESDRQPITGDEWLALIESDPELMIDPSEPKEAEIFGVHGRGAPGQ
jgi:hypothetical protein